MKEKNSLEKAENNVGNKKRELSIKFKNAGILSYNIDADLIINKITGIKREKILAYPEIKLTEKQSTEIDKLALKRVKRYPIAYILGYKDFFSNRFIVTENVLIPRPETEHLIEAFLKYAHDISSILDLCTGSGCIGITCKFKVPHLNVTLSDKSKKALRIAKLNAEKILGKNKVIIKKSNLFNKIKKKFDAILCNPPYVSIDEYLSLSKDVHFEPKKALIADNSGLKFYEAIAKQAKKYLKSRGFIFFEIGEKQADRIIEIYQSNNYIFRELIKDYSGKDRILVFSKK